MSHIVCPFCPAVASWDLQPLQLPSKIRNHFLSSFPCPWSQILCVQLSVFPEGMTGKCHWVDEQLRWEHTGPLYIHTGRLSLNSHWTPGTGSSQHPALPHLELTCWLPGILNAVSNCYLSPVVSSIIYIYIYQTNPSISSPHIAAGVFLEWEFFSSKWVSLQLVTNVFSLWACVPMYIKIYKSMYSFGYLDKNSNVLIFFFV